jgi:phosphoserine phosphatase RsbU/P
MNKPIRILHLEDDPIDAELIAMQLKSEEWVQDVVWVKSEREFVAALLSGGFDLILSDNAGPSFNGHDALVLSKEKSPQTPFVFLSGAATPEAMADAVQKGASGYVLKAPLSVLGPSIQRVLEKK